VSPRLEPGLAARVLNALEDVELPLLSWGVTAGTLAHEEVLEVIDRELISCAAASAGITPADALDELLRDALLLRIPATSPPRYRTRLSETVRLTTRLRQLFGPRDLQQPQAGWWEQGKPLVADYRLHVSPRRYPIRDIPLSQALKDLQELVGWGKLQSDVASAQLGDRDLAAFQVSAVRAVFASLKGSVGRGVVVGAGTGSGKTLAFYLPAFAAMADQAFPGRHRIHTLAVYPRKELLRDQLRDAVATARLVAGELTATGRRPLRIGALYGDTPHSPTEGRLQTGDFWRRRQGGLVCPYLSCPGPGSDPASGSLCGGDLIWADGDRTTGKETLRCSVCALRLDDEVALSRQSMRERPPDLLFTTTEMLNRNASTSLGQMMGWRGGPAPSLVLLDEAHTYAGVHGAQVALLLRRWRNDVRSPVTFVGLSATLRDARAFFAQLTGLDEAVVDHVEPAPAQLRSEGREYAIALRGDPVSGTSLLSTSIQTAMLFGRVLDLRGEESLYGSTGFIFTDDLDVTNRFYDDLREAEGRQDRFGRRPGHGRVLAALRSPDAPYATERFRDGQSWDLVQHIGRTLPPAADIGHLRIGRTSSQDVGVDEDADLIVATASLEVGYNDPRVGLVIQHKAPHDRAAFIQRRGRAGRRRDMRPWTVITLSDYGRDRLAYQAYDTLFAPEISARSLPIGNRFVLKIQGTQALLDWLAAKLAAGGRREADPRELLRALKGDRPRNDDQTVALVRLLDSLLGDTALQDALAAHLGKALRISKDEVQAIMWEQPRALLLGVVPTALRRLRSGWRPVDADPGANPGDLLPEYITGTLFGALNVPEVRLLMPFGGVEDDILPIEKALLREAVPGRVSRRYGHRRDEHRTWLPLPAPGGAALDLSSIIVAGSRLGTWQLPGRDAIEVVRPFQLRLAEPPVDVSDQAQGTPLWASQIVEPSAGIYEAAIPDPSPWSTRVTSLGFATHAAGNPVEVRRMTFGAQCETTYQGGRRDSSTVHYTIDEAPAAMGFNLVVDALRFTIAPLDVTDQSVAHHLSSPEWRTLAFTRAVAEDPSLDDVANTFQRTWLTMVYLTSFALSGLDGTRSTQQIHAQLAGGAWAANLGDVLRVLYREAPTAGQTAAPERLIAALTELSHDSAVTACIDRHGRLLYAADMVTLTADLARRAYTDTVAAALLAATQRACPDAQDGDLIVDVLPGDAAHDAATVWLSETAIGGLGVVEHFVHFYAQDPRRFWGLVDSALEPGDHEYVDATLTRLMEHVADNPTGPAPQAMADLRLAESAREADAALGRLRDAWAALDGHPRHAAVAALSTRLLRPGSSRTTDLTARAVLREWGNIQRRLGFEIDARTIAYAVGSGRLAVEGGDSITGDQVFSMLWPRGGQARVQHLQYYQPYASPPVLDRLLAAAANDPRLPVVDVTVADWPDHYTRAMVEHGAVELAAPTDQCPALAEALRQVPVRGIDRDVLRVYGEVRKIIRSDRCLLARVEIREAAQ
jgi:ATP-dependent Lhr-like helicase